LLVDPVDVAPPLPADDAVDRLVVDGEKAAEILPAGSAGRLRARPASTAIDGWAQSASRTSNAGCFPAIAWISASLESGPTPSKNGPTSTFHRFR
jgi:hypothetical protein